MDFSNREIAAYLWLGVLFIILSLKSHVRRDSFRDVISAFCNRFILILLILAVLYIAGLVVLLKWIGVWTSANWKTTIIWVMSFAFVTMFDASRVTKYRTYFVDTIKEAIGLTGLLIFIVEFYSFNIIIELITVPIFVFLAIVHTTSKEPNHIRLRSFVGQLLTVAGLFYLGFSIYHTIIDFKGFATLDTAREFLVPLLLTLGFLPFLYALMVYVAYERNFIGITWGVKNPKLQWQAKWLAVSKFGPNLGLLNRWVNSIQRFPPENRKELWQSVTDMYNLAEKEKNPPHVDADKGWSPYLAMNFLMREGLPTRDYYRSYEDEWFAGSDYLEIGTGILKNNVAYYLNGNEHAVTKLKLLLNVNAPESPNEAESCFIKIAQTLTRSALVDEIDQSIYQHFDTAEIWDAFTQGKNIQMDKQVWRGGIPGGYSRSLSISIAEKPLGNSS